MTIVITILILIAIIVALLGIIGAVVPNMPGPPLCFASLLTAYFTCPGMISIKLLLWMLALTILVTILDFVAPIVMTRLGGGSKYAMWGSTLGIIAGMFFMPWGIILGPLVGAFMGEILHNSNFTHATKVATMSFISFLLGTGLKLIASLLMTFYTFAAIWNFGRHVLF
ncbi:MAG: DUF456 domain-containing protein [Bacteroidaceae bacterium]|nr:DUF456 domain-containing protein [Bacteroidaceae bacterium]